jgi:hypothetical protein
MRPIPHALSIYLCNKIMNIQKIYSLKCCTGENKSVNLRLLKKIN